MSQTLHIPTEASAILDRYSAYTLTTLDEAFRTGAAFTYEEIRGETMGRFVGWNPANGWWLRLAIYTLFLAPWALWSGKYFLSAFEGARRGTGINLFKRGLRRRNYAFDTYVKPAYRDGQPCTALDYRPYFSLMRGLCDDVRKVESGVFLGQMFYFFPWRRDPWFVGYFVLVPIAHAGTFAAGRRRPGGALREESRP
jgi:hypothetical protein